VGRGGAAVKVAIYAAVTFFIRVLDLNERVVEGWVH